MTSDQLPVLAADEVAGFMVEAATGILLRKDGLRSLDGHGSACAFVFESLTAAVEVAQQSVRDDPAIEWVVVDRHGQCLRTIRATVTD